MLLLSGGMVCVYIHQTMKTDKEFTKIKRKKNIHMLLCLYAFTHTHTHTHQTHAHTHTYTHTHTHSTAHQSTEIIQKQGMGRWWLENLLSVVDFKQRGLQSSFKSNNG